MAETPREDASGELNFVTIVDDIEALGLRAHAAPGKTNDPIVADCIKKARERIDRYCAALEKAPTRLGWSNDQVEEHRAELRRQLRMWSEHHHLWVKHIVSKAVERLDEEPTR